MIDSIFQNVPTNTYGGSGPIVSRETRKKHRTAPQQQTPRLVDEEPESLFTPNPETESVDDHTPASERPVPVCSSKPTHQDRTWVPILLLCAILIASLYTRVIQAPLPQPSVEVKYPAMPDYALYTGGARIIESHTSPTYGIYSTTLHKTFGGKRLPEMAIKPSTDAGKCWPIAGSQGQIAIKLIAPIPVTNITIGHLSRYEAIDITSAPRELELWGQPADSDTYSPVCLAAFTYNVFDLPVQTVAVGQSIKVSSVILKIQSNWGNVHFTCLYRVSIHGDRIPNKIAR